MLSLKTENEWLEYKENNSDPNLIGEYISVLCNSAILEGQDKALNKEVIGDTFRKNEYQYPKIAIRETVANALVHQDFLEGNKGPLIEIYSDRIEVTNLGKPLIDTKRFIDHTPK